MGIALMSVLWQASVVYSSRTVCSPSVKNNFCGYYSTFATISNFRVESASLAVDATVHLLVYYCFK